MANIKRTFIKGSRTTPPDEIDRKAEEIYNQFRKHIKDKATYDQVINSYIGKPEGLNQARFFKNVFKKIQSRHPRQVSNQDIFKKAGGKNLSKDQKTTSKTVVTNQKEYIKKGAQKTDLQGYDTATAGMIKGKVVIVHMEILTIKKGKLKGRKIVRYRDSKGRFASYQKIGREEL